MIFERLWQELGIGKIIHRILSVGGGEEEPKTAVLSPCDL
jgi:hypothetical protein